MRRADRSRWIDHHRGLARVTFIHNGGPQTLVGPNKLVVYAARPAKRPPTATHHSPFSASLIARLKEPGVEITQGSDSVTGDVYGVTSKMSAYFRISKRVLELLQCQILVRRNPPL